MYGDNFLKSCKYHVTAVCSKQLPPGCPERLRQVEGLLWAKRQELAGFEEEYREAVRRYKSAQERYEAESKGLEDLLKVPSLPPALPCEASAAAPPLPVA